MSPTTDLSINNNDVLTTGKLEPRFRLPKLEPRKRDPSARTSPLPLPETPKLPAPPDLSSLNFKKPTRRILSPKDHELFLGSPTHQLVLAFVFSLTESVIDTPISAVKESELSPTLRNIVLILDQVKDAVERCPPEDQGDSRFGNKGFRDFLDLCSKEHTNWHSSLAITSPEAVSEISTYFLESFGNWTRIDYGSGHELNFIIWLLCLYQLNLITPSDFQPLVLVIFTKYLELMRLVQCTYYLEPAGSHGVWGLDDYQFLPFLFGSSQLLHHAYIRPLSIHQSFIIEEYKSDYLYLAQVSFVNSVKNIEGLRWHSPMLDDISSAKSWSKIESGMRRMFVAEILRKLPVMQHFLFGSLVPAVNGMTVEEEFTNSSDKVNHSEETVVHADGIKHTHLANSWGDCCGIRVPSSIAAAHEMKKKMGGGRENLRRIPFD